MRRFLIISLLVVIALMPVTKFSDKDISGVAIAPVPMETQVSVKKGPMVKGAYIKIIEAAAATNNLPASLISAIIKVESGFNPNAISSRGAIGLMQLSMSTRKAMNVKNPFDPVQNILAGAAYLRQLLDRFKGDVEMAVAAYNAGPSAVERHGGIPPFGQTQAFVPKVMDYYSDYEAGSVID